MAIEMNQIIIIGVCHLMTKCPKCSFNHASGTVYVIYTGQNYFLTCNQCSFTDWIGDDENGKSENFYRWNEYFKFDSKFNRGNIGSQTVETSLLLD